MSAFGFLQVAVFLGALLALARPLGDFMARVLQGRPCGLDWLFRWPERLICKAMGPQAAAEMTWKHYAVAILTFNAVGLLFVYGLQRFQGLLPLNPQGFPGVGADSSFNTAISFASNTNWQGYGGESTMSHLTQMLGLAVQNFLSAATGIAVLAALARGFARRSSATIGNAWTDLVRSTLYILIPISTIWALALVSQGVVQNFAPNQTAALLRPAQDADGKEVVEQSLPQGPAASQIAIKQLGTNGGGFFNVNSAHPYENSTPLSNFLEVLAILVIPAALCRTFGVMIGDARQGWALLAVMTVIFAPLALANVWAEESGVPAVAKLGVDPGPGHMEGKEVRFGAATSALWATVTTAASNGSVNAMHDSFTPLGGLIPMWLMQLGEVIYGGAGSGLYGMLMFALIAVFIAGLMVGRTPEYLGKKIEAFEMKMAALVVLIPAATVLVGTAIAVSGPGFKSLANPGAHGFSEVLYAFSSASNNNGSAFGGLSANVPFYNIALGLAMFFGRYLLIVPVLAVAGSLARKGATPTTSGTLPTHTPLFVLLLAGTVILVGALTFIPALALGPIVEHLQMIQG